MRPASEPDMVRLDEARIAMEIQREMCPPDMGRIAAIARQRCICPDITDFARQETRGKRATSLDGGASDTASGMQEITGAG